MSLHTQRRVIVHGGRRCVVSAPTVQTVLTAVRVFAQEIVLLRREFLKSEHLPAETWIDVCARMLLAKSRAAADVLSTCCSLWEGAPGELEELAAADAVLREKLGRAVVSLCDPSTIIARLSWEAIDAAVSGAPVEPEEDEPDDGPSAIEILVVTVAQAFHQPPASVMDWPYQMVTDLFETILPACNSSQKVDETSKAKLAEYGVH